MLLPSQTPQRSSDIGHAGDARGDIATLLISTLALRPVDSLLRNSVTDRLEQTALTHLACG